jgi:hypothetical protein
VDAIFLIVHHLQVEATFLRAVHENIEDNHLTLEVNSLKYVIHLCLLFEVECSLRDKNSL